MPKRSVILLLTGLLTVTTLAAQTPLREGTTEREAHQEAVRTEAQSDTAMTLTAADRSLELTKRELKQAEKGTFVPDPKKATYLALVPGVGLGQIYNRKYWKLPLVYAGYAGLIYALVYSNNNYRDYKRAYISIADQDETTNEYTKYIPAGKDETTVDKAWLSNALNQRYMRFRRYRDLSIIGLVAWYGLTVLDAYVDAQLFDFDISPDLSQVNMTYRMHF